MLISRRAIFARGANLYRSVVLDVGVKNGNIGCNVD